VKTFRSSTFILRTSLIALTLAAAATVAQAGSVTYTATVPTQLTDLTNVPVTPLLQEFNSALGTLDSVTISIQGNGQTQFLSITNNGASATTFQGIETTQLWLDDPTSSGIDSLLTPLTATVTGSSPAVTLVHGVPTGGITLAAGASGGPYGPYTMSGALASQTYTAPAALALFIGSGNLDFVLSTSSGFNFISYGSNNLTDTIQTLAGATVDITYDYTNPPTVPEPNSLFLFGTGLLGLAGALRYKFVKSR
jgi:hypothetical protein